MTIPRVYSLLCTIACAALLVLALGSQQGTAQQDKNHELLPIADGPVFDDNPFDGVGDAFDDTLLNTLALNAGIAEVRPAIEFNLGHINPRRVESATLRIVSTGTGVLPGTTTVPVEVFGYSGDGLIQNEDFSAGSFVTVFDTLATPQNVPVLVDVTEFVQGLHPGQPRIVGFNLRTSVHGVQVNYGSLETAPAPVLLLTLK